MKVTCSQCRVGVRIETQGDHRWRIVRGEGFMLGCAHREAYFSGTLQECPVLQECLHRKLARRGRRQVSPVAATPAPQGACGALRSHAPAWTVRGLLAVAALLRFVPGSFDTLIG